MYGPRILAVDNKKFRNISLFVILYITMIPLENRFHLACDGRSRKVYLKNGSAAHYVRYKKKFIRKTELNKIIKTTRFNKVQQGSGGGKRYVFLSDLEGCIPLNLVKNVLCTSQSESITEENKFNFDTFLDPETHIVFTGDLIDRGNESLRLLQTFEVLASNGFATLVVGNRDVNKMRLKHELWSKSLENILKQYTQYISLQEIIDVINTNQSLEPDWLYAWDDLKTIINSPGIRSGKRDANNKLIDDDIMPKHYQNWGRVIWTYENTFGAGKALHFFREELKLLGVTIDDNFSDDMLGSLLAMIMSHNWSANIYVNDLNLTNLYCRYLSKTTLLFENVIGVNYVFATHSGLPKCTNSNSKFCKDHILFHKSKQRISANILYNNPGEIGYNDIITQFYANTLARNTEEFKTLMFMAAACGGHIQSRSPIVGYTSNDADGPCQWENEQYTIAYSSIQLIHNVFNICGHQPVGIVPEVGKVTQNNVDHYHVRLDVSKAEDIQNTNTNVYCALLMDSNSITIKCSGEVPSKRIKRNNNASRNVNRTSDNFFIDVNKPINDYHDASRKDGNRRYFPINETQESMQRGFDIRVRPILNNGG